jgi:hypothetical protein
LKIPAAALPILLCFALTLPFSTQVRAARPVQMLVRAGFDGAGKVGGWLPLSVDIRNDGEDIDGEIQIAVQDTSSGQRSASSIAPTIFTSPISLPRRARKNLQMEIRLPNSPQRIRAKLLQGEEVILDQDVQLTRVPTSDLFCGMLSRTGAALEFIPALELAPPLRRVRLAHLDVSDVPTRPQVMTSLDCMIVDNIPTAGMSDAQRDALGSWVANGGLLIVGGGAGWQRTLAGLPQELLPVRVSGTAVVDNLANLAEFGQEPFPDAGQYLASQGAAVDSHVIVEQGGVPLLAAARRGLGTVFYLGLDPAAEPLRSWPGSINLWRYLLSHTVTNSTLAPSGASPFSGWGRAPRNAMIDISPLTPPSPLPLVVVLLAFGLAVGPGNYLIFRRLGHPSWVVLTVPLMTLVASLLLFGLAGANRDSEAIMTRISLVRSMPGAPIDHARTYVGLLSRQQNEYEVKAGEGALIYGLYFPFPRDQSAERSGWGLKVVDGPRPAVSELTLAGGSLATFVVDSFRKPGGLESDLTADGRSVLGTITNNTGHAVSDASIILDFGVTRLGDLQPGESKEINIALAPAATAGYGAPNSFSSQLYPTGQPQKRHSDAARRDLLDAAFGQAFNFTKLEMLGPTLLGWVETGVVDLEVRPSAPSVIENTLYVTTLQVRLPRGYEGDIPAPLVTHRPLGATTVSRQQFGTYELVPGESVALQFSLPTHLGRFLLERLNLNVDGRLRGGPGANRSTFGEIQLYNWRTSEWDEQPFTVGSNALANPRSYVSGTGDVRVRYTFRPPPESGLTGVSFSRLDINATGLMR